ncbi:MAG TPA: heparinase II/III family protein [Kineosporiaceae bacterium]|nr:heparinase II/III family protein [Kineosporiaceae bacterium]
MGAPVAARPTPRPHVITAVGGLGADEAAAAAAAAPARCATATATPVPDGKPIVVSLPPAPRFTVGKIPASWWRHPPVSTASWQLAFLGLTWLPPLAQRAADDRQWSSVAALVQQVVTFHSQNPDPGTNAYGWDEGTAMRRLQTESCLYRLSRSSRLAGSITADVNVQFSTRYYGPPRFPVHNHGIMANLAVLDAAQLLGRATWRDKILARFRSEAPRAWTRAGTSWEQSSTYHALDMRLWNRVADAVAQVRPKDGVITLIRSLTARADRVLAWMTEPDGKLVLIGDSDESKGTTRSTWTTRVFRDDQAGLVVGRWAWRDPTTSYYTLRYGPPRWGHGQQDRTGVTWSARGLRILVNPGRFTYDASPYQAYAVGQSSHNVAYPSGSLYTRAAASVTAMTIRAPAQSWTLVDSLYGVRHVRGVMVQRARPSLAVADSFAGGRAFRQMWHLDPSWTLVSRSRNGKRLTFRSGGHVLTVTTTGVFTAVVRGATRPVGGWHFPSHGHRVASAEFATTARGSARTTFVVG